MFKLMVGGVRAERALQVIRTRTYRMLEYSSNDQNLWMGLGEVE